MFAISLGALKNFRSRNLKDVSSTLDSGFPILRVMTKLITPEELEEIYASDSAGEC